MDGHPVEANLRSALFGPRRESAPLITTLVDASGLVIYLLIAKALLSALQ